MQRRLAVLMLLLGPFLLSGCATYWTAQKGDSLLAKGRMAEGLEHLAKAAERDPTRYRMHYLKTRDALVQKRLLEARRLRQQGQSDAALQRYSDILSFDPQHVEALQGVAVVERERRAMAAMGEAKEAVSGNDAIKARQRLREVLRDNPEHGEARLLLEKIEVTDQRSSLEEPALKASLRKPVSLEFREASIQAIFEVLSRSSGINFIFDRDVKSDIRTTIFAKNTSIEDALNLILNTNNLKRKVLNDSTFLIYPDSPEKRNQFEELVTRSFYLGSADPRKVQEMVRALINPKSMYVDEKLKLLVLRDGMEVIDAVERLIEVYDIAEPEVVLEVEILEVGTDKLLNLGIQYPDQISASVSGAAGKAGQLTVDEIRALNKSNVTLFVPDPLAVLNFKQTSALANTLANPRIRVRNREKAKVLIGDKVPVVTTTSNQTSGSISESVAYLDVGLKLEVEPEVHVNNDVSINVVLEVSNIVKEIKTSTGLLTYQIGTRNANTVLRLRDGETQMLAGLIRDDERQSASHIPGIGKIPLLGKLFSNESSTSAKSEIILLITPHVVRGLHVPGATSRAFASGTTNAVSTRPLRLTQSGRVGGDKKSVAAPMSAPIAAPVPRVEAEPSVEDDEEYASSSEPVVAAENAQIRLDIVMPAQIPAGQEFTLMMSLSGQAFKQLSVDLAFDQSGLELVRAQPVAPVGRFEYQPMPEAFRMRFEDVPAHNGPLAVLTLRAAQALDKPISLRLTAAEASNSNDALMLVSTGGARVLRIISP
ncbi:MAG: hypothetical protein Q8J78_16320 [Moraxellaceae bacterium]|nr:hypothetical protein [Moraxellaceae bacterium]